jgi:hypothetical protein
MHGVDSANQSTAAAVQVLTGPACHGHHASFVVFGSQPDVLKPCAFMTLTTALLISLYSTYAGTANDRVVVPCPVAAGPFSLHPDYTLC